MIDTAGTVLLEKPYAPDPGDRRGQPRADYLAGYSDARYGKFGDGIVAAELSTAYRDGFREGIQ